MHCAHGVSRRELLRVATSIAGESPDYDPESPGYCSAFPEGRAFRYEVAAALTMLAAETRPVRTTVATGTDSLATLLASCSRALLK